MTRQQLQFLLRITPPALESERDFEIPACITLAQAILESSTPLYGWGSSRLFRLANNPFGIKVSHASSLEPYGEFDARTVEYRPGTRAGERPSAATDGKDAGSVRPAAGGLATQQARVPAVQPYTEVAKFQRFGSLAEAFAAHARLLMTSRYGPAYAVRHDWKQFAERLGPKTSVSDTDHCGYSTNPGYAAQLIRIVQTCRLDDRRAQAWLATGTDPGPVLEAMLA